ncbi:MAG: hypothetical protein HY591_06615, partial [Candidatus Omnitrophica bacterium]|nr:hypothetical protein [Candidatus Omnitrophota bacterium]
KDFLGREEDYLSDYELHAGNGLVQVGDIISKGQLDEFLAERMHAPPDLQDILKDIRKDWSASLRHGKLQAVINFLKQKLPAENRQITLSLLVFAFGLGYSAAPESRSGEYKSYLKNLAPALRIGVGNDVFDLIDNLALRKDLQQEYKDGMADDGLPSLLELGLILKSIESRQGPFAAYAPEKLKQMEDAYKALQEGRMLQMQAKLFQAYKSYAAFVQANLKGIDLKVFYGGDMTSLFISAGMILFNFVLPRILPGTVKEEKLRPAMLRGEQALTSMAMSIGRPELKGEARAVVEGRQYINTSAGVITVMPFTSRPPASSQEQGSSAIGGTIFENENAKIVVSQGNLASGEGARSQYGLRTVQPLGEWEHVGENQLKDSASLYGLYFSQFNSPNVGLRLNTPQEQIIGVGSNQEWGINGLRANEEIKVITGQDGKPRVFIALGAQNTKENGVWKQGDLAAAGIELSEHEMSFFMGGRKVFSQGPYQGTVTISYQDKRSGQHINVDGKDKTQKNEDRTLTLDYAQQLGGGWVIRSTASLINGSNAGQFNPSLTGKDNGQQFLITFETTNRVANLLDVGAGIELTTAKGQKAHINPYLTTALGTALGIKALRVQAGYDTTGHKPTFKAFWQESFTKQDLNPYAGIQSLGNGGFEALIGARHNNSADSSYMEGFLNAQQNGHTVNGAFNAALGNESFNFGGAVDFSGSSTLQARWSPFAERNYHQYTAEVRPYSERFLAQGNIQLLTDTAQREFVDRLADVLHQAFDTNITDRPDSGLRKNLKTLGVPEDRMPFFFRARFLYDDTLARKGMFASFNDLIAALVEIKGLRKGEYLVSNYLGYSGERAGHVNIAKAIDFWELLYWAMARKSGQTLGAITERLSQFVQMRNGVAALAGKEGAFDPADAAVAGLLHFFTDKFKGNAGKALNWLQNANKDYYGYLRKLADRDFKIVEQDGMAFLLSWLEEFSRSGGNDQETRKVMFQYVQAIVDGRDEFKHRASLPLDRLTPQALAEVMDLARRLHKSHLVRDSENEQNTRSIYYEPGAYSDGEVREIARLYFGLPKTLPEDLHFELARNLVELAQSQQDFRGKLDIKVLNAAVQAINGSETVRNILVKTGRDASVQGKVLAAFVLYQYYEQNFTALLSKQIPMVVKIVMDHIKVDFADIMAIRSLVYWAKVAAVLEKDGKADVYKRMERMFVLTPGQFTSRLSADQPLPDILSGKGEQALADPKVKAAVDQIKDLVGGILSGGLVKVSAEQKRGVEAKLKGLQVHHNAQVNGGANYDADTQSIVYLNPNAPAAQIVAHEMFGVLGADHIFNRAAEHLAADYIERGKVDFGVIDTPRVQAQLAAEGIKGVTAQTFIAHLSKHLGTPGHDREFTGPKGDSLMAMLSSPLTAAPAKAAEKSLAQQAKAQDPLFDKLVASPVFTQFFFNVAPNQWEGQFGNNQTAVDFVKAQANIVRSEFSGNDRAYLDQVDRIARMLKDDDNRPSHPLRALLKGGQEIARRFDSAGLAETMKILAEFAERSISAGSFAGIHTKGKVINVDSGQLEMVDTIGSFELIEALDRVLQIVQAGGLSVINQAAEFGTDKFYTPGDDRTAKVRAFLFGLADSVHSSIHTRGSNINIDTARLNVNAITLDPVKNTGTAIVNQFKNILQIKNTRQGFFDAIASLYELQGTKFVGTAGVVSGGDVTKSAVLRQILANAVVDVGKTQVIRINIDTAAEETKTVPMVTLPDVINGINQAVAFKAAGMIE